MRYERDDENDAEDWVKWEEEFHLETKLIEEIQADENKSNREGNNHNAETNVEESSIEVIKESAEELKVDVSLQVQFCDNFAISIVRVLKEIITRELYSKRVRILDT